MPRGALATVVLLIGLAIYIVVVPDNLQGLLVMLNLIIWPAAALVRWSAPRR